MVVGGEAFSSSSKGRLMAGDGGYLGRETSTWHTSRKKHEMTYFSRSDFLYCDGKVSFFVHFFLFVVFVRVCLIEYGPRCGFLNSKKHGCVGLLFGFCLLISIRLCC